MPVRWPWVAFAVLLLTLCVAPATAISREYLRVVVTAPYVEMRTGPGRGYPVFHVAARDESVEVLKRRTDWYKVRTARGIEGWVSRHDMLSTVYEDGTPFEAGYRAHGAQARAMLPGEDGTKGAKQ